MNEKDLDSMLENLLRKPDPYIDDRGFTDKVLKALPSRPVTLRMRVFILSFCAIVASITAVALTPISVINHYYNLFSTFIMNLYSHDTTGALNNIHIGTIPVAGIAVALLLVWGAVIVVRSR